MTRCLRRIMLCGDAVALFAGCRAATSLGAAAHEPVGYSWPLKLDSSGAPELGTAGGSPRSRRKPLPPRPSHQSPGQVTRKILVRPGTKTLRDTADHQIAHPHRAAPFPQRRALGFADRRQPPQQRHDRVPRRLRRGLALSPDEVMSPCNGQGDITQFGLPPTAERLSWAVISVTTPLGWGLFLSADERHPCDFQKTLAYWFAGNPRRANGQRGTVDSGRRDNNGRDNNRRGGVRAGHGARQARQHDLDLRG